MWNIFVEVVECNCENHGMTFSSKTNLGLGMKNSTDAINTVGIEKVDIDIHFSNITSTNQTTLLKVSLGESHYYTNVIVNTIS